jgi:hypothetical protein
MAVPLEVNRRKFFMLTRANEGQARTFHIKVRINCSKDDPDTAFIWDKNGHPGE